MAMSLEEKLHIIDQELEALHQCCLRQGLSPAEIERKAAPVIGPVKAAQRKKTLQKWKSRAKVFVVAAVLVCGLVYYDPAYRLLRVYARLAQLQTLPFWDWSELYNQECMVHNPFYVGEPITEEDCEICDGLTTIGRVSNISQYMMAEEYLKRDQPVIVTDAITDWPATEKFTFSFLHDLYQTESKLKEALPCMFASNLGSRHLTPTPILRKAAAGELKNWYTHWENCDKSAAKYMRQFYKRPYFLPPMVQSSEGNWILLSHNYSGKLFKPIDTASPMTWLALLKGQLKVKVSPKDPCHSACETLYATLHAGEILVTTDLIWYLDYLPNSTGETIAIAVGGQFD